MSHYPHSSPDLLAANKPDQPNWLDPLNKMIWQRAFKARAKDMTLRDGRVFKIRYEPGKDREGKPVTMAWVQVDGWVTNGPCGWFVVEKVLDPTWVRDVSGVLRTGGSDA
jgi:hypothetical protein